MSQLGGSVDPGAVGQVGLCPGVSPLCGLYHLPPLCQLHGQGCAPHGNHDDPAHETGRSQSQLSGAGHPSSNPWPGTASGWWRGGGCPGQSTGGRCQSPVREQPLGVSHPPPPLDQQIIPTGAWHLTLIAPNAAGVTSACLLRHLTPPPKKTLSAPMCPQAQPGVSKANARAEVVSH